MSASYKILSAVAFGIFTFVSSANAQNTAEEDIQENYKTCEAQCRNDYKDNDGDRLACWRVCQDKLKEDLDKLQEKGK